MDIEFQTVQKVLQNLSYQSPMAIFFTWKCLVTFFQASFGLLFFFQSFNPKLLVEEIYINIFQVLSKSLGNFVQELKTCFWGRCFWQNWHPGRLTAGTYSHHPCKERKMIWTKPPGNYVPAVNLHGCSDIWKSITFIPSTWSRGFNAWPSPFRPKKDDFFFLTFFETGNWKDGCFQLDDSQNFTMEKWLEITFSIHLAKTAWLYTFRVQISHHDTWIRRVFNMHLHHWFPPKRHGRIQCVFFFTPKLGFFRIKREGWSSIHGVDVLTHGKQWFSFC